MIDRLLQKNPRRRANCQDIIEHSWKIDVKNAGFIKAHSKFKQTVFKRKIQSKTRANTANAPDAALFFETSPTSPKSKEIQNRMKELVESGINSLDDSVLKRRGPGRKKMSIVQFDAEQKESQMEAWKVGQNAKKSKTTEYLYLEHLSPINPRDSIFFVDNENLMEELPEFPQFDLVSYSNRSSMISNNALLPMSPTTRQSSREISPKGARGLSAISIKPRTNTNVSTITEESDQSGSHLSSSGSLSPTKPPAGGYYHSPANSGGSGTYHAYSYSRNRLSLLSSRSFLESFTNKRKSVSNYRRSSAHNDDTKDYDSDNNSNNEQAKKRRKKRSTKSKRSTRSSKYGSRLGIGDGIDNGIERKLDKMLNDESVNKVHKNDSWCTLEEKLDQLPQISPRNRKRKVTFPDDTEKPSITEIKFRKASSANTYSDYNVEEKTNNPILSYSSYSLTNPNLPFWNVSSNHSNNTGISNITANSNDNGIDITMLQSLAVSDDGFNSDTALTQNTHVLNQQVSLLSSDGDAREHTFQTFIKHSSNTSYNDMTSDDESTLKKDNSNNNNNNNNNNNKVTHRHRIQISDYEFVDNHYMKFNTNDNDNEENCQFSSL